MQARSIRAKPGRMLIGAGKGRSVLAVPAVWHTLRSVNRQSNYAASPPTPGSELGGHRRPGLHAGLLSPPVTLAEPFRPGLVFGRHHFFVRHCPLGVCLCVAHGIHPSAGFNSQAGTAGCSSRQRWLGSSRRRCLICCSTRRSGPEFPKNIRRICSTGWPRCCFHWPSTSCF